MKGLKRYLVHCNKCGYEWLAYKPNPTRCALCNNPNIEKEKVRKHIYEKNTTVEG
jgi:predicted Zn-ribbon and HTH transcriptional regulator